MVSITRVKQNLNDWHECNESIMQYIAFRLIHYWIEKLQWHVNCSLYVQLLYKNVLRKTFVVKMKMMCSSGELFFVKKYEMHLQEYLWLPPVSSSFLSV